MLNPSTGKGMDWWVIPGGTQLPDGIKVTKQVPHPIWLITHYTFEPEYDMPLLKFIDLLERLSRNADKLNSSTVKEAFKRVTDVA